MKTITEPERSIPVSYEVDVLVVGGGPAGIPAAIAAARNGAKVLLVERHGSLGGLMTNGMVESYSWFLGPKTVAVDGLAREIEERMRQVGGLAPHTSGSRNRPSGRVGVSFDAEKLKFLADNMMQEAGVKLLFHTWAARAFMEGQAARGLIIENKSGRQAILAKAVIDATGDGDVAASAGAPFDKGRPADGLMEPATMSFRVSGVDLAKLEAWLDADPQNMPRAVEEAKKNGEYKVPRKGVSWNRVTDAGELTGVNGTRIHRIDSTNAEDLTYAELEGRRQVWEIVHFLQKHVPGGEKCQLAATPAQVGPRESRRIRGGYVLTEEDVLKCSRFPDAVARFCSLIDIHSPTGPDTRMVFPEADEYYQIPYRSLVPQGVENVLVAGRCISATHEAEGSTRQMMCCMATGQAAGTAAALAAKVGVAVRDLDVGRLQAALAAQGLTIG